MLQTSAIKTDQATSTQAVKDKDPTAGASSVANGLEADFTSYFSQMMAALPGLQQQLPASALPAPAPAPRADPARKAAQGGQAGSQAAPAAGDTTQAAAMAGAAAVSAQAPGASQAANAQSGPQTSTASGAGSAAQANGPAQSGGQAGSAQAGTAQGSTDPKAAAPAKSAQAAASAAQPDPAAPSGTAPAAADATDAQAAARAIAQAFPGGKFQIQYGEAGSNGAQGATSKQPLTEFLNQSAVDPKATPQDSTLPAGNMAQNLAQTLGQAFSQSMPAAGAAGLAGLQAVAGLQSPLVATTAQQASGQVTGVQTAGSGVTLAGNLASSQLGAGALPGAAGAVRVTAAGPARNALPSAQEDVLAQVDGSIRWLVKNQDKSAELQLHPESLGRVQVKLTVEGNVVHAKLWASEASAVPLLQEHRGYLEESLKQQGLSLGSFDLQQGRRQEQAPLPTPSESNLAVSSSAAAGLSGQESPAAVAVASINAGRVEFVA